MDKPDNDFEHTRLNAIQFAQHSASYMAGLGDMCEDAESANYFYACATYLREWIDGVLPPREEWPVNVVRFPIERRG